MLRINLICFSVFFFFAFLLADGLRIFENFPSGLNESNTRFIVCRANPVNQVHLVHQARKELPVLRVTMDGPARPESLAYRVT